MNAGYHIPEPFQFNPLKHHLEFIRQYISSKLNDESRLDIPGLVREVRRIGSSVTDVYTGIIPVLNICLEIKEYLHKKGLDNSGDFSTWAGKTSVDFKIVTVSDSSVWMLKFHHDPARYIHIFPARNSPHSKRIKANTLMSAILYYIIIGKDLITREDMNRARSLLGLSPVKGTSEAESITGMIEILRA